MVLRQPKGSLRRNWHNIVTSWATVEVKVWLKIENI